MKAAIYDLSLSEKEKVKELLKEFLDLKVEIKENPVNEEQSRDYDAICVFVHSKIDKEVIDKFPNLKAIITMSTGFDHIDLDYCKERGIAVYNIPDYGSETVAEFTLLLILATLRKFNLIMEDVKCSLCIDAEHLKGRELGKKIVGVIGTGKIGSHLIKLLQGFDVKILAYNKREVEELKKRYGVEYTSLEDLLKRSDIITLHLPLTKETKHILNEEKLGLLKKNAVIINTARGQLIDTSALIKRMDILYAGLDVVEGEKLTIKEIDITRKKYDKDEFMNAFFIDFLIKHPNAIITPHIAYNTEEGEYRRMRKTIETLHKFKKGEANTYNRIV